MFNLISLIIYGFLKETEFRLTEFRTVGNFLSTATRILPVTEW